MLPISQQFLKNVLEGLHLSVEFSDIRLMRLLSVGQTIHYFSNHFLVALFLTAELSACRQNTMIVVALLR